MTKGLFTSTEEIYFQDVCCGRIGHTKGFSKDQHQIRQENQRVSRNVKRLNQLASQNRQIISIR